MADTLPRSYRLSEGAIAQVEALSRRLGDMPASAVVRLAISRLAQEELGAAAPEPGTARPPGRPKSANQKKQKR